MLSQTSLLRIGLRDDLLAVHGIEEIHDLVVSRVFWPVMREAPCQRSALESTLLPVKRQLTV